MNDAQIGFNSLDQTTIGSFEAQFSPDLRRGNVIVALSLGWMVDLGGPTGLLKLAVRFLPRGRLGGFLSPMSDGSLVTPFEQAPHDAAVNSSEHEIFHVLLGGPKRAGPKGVSSVPQNGNRQDAGSGLGLSRRAKRLHEEGRKVAPGAHAKACKGNEDRVYRHGRVTSASVKTS